MTTIATVLKTRTAYLAAAKTLDDTKERIWEKHYGDIAPDDDQDGRQGPRRPDQPHPQGVPGQPSRRAVIFSSPTPLRPVSPRSM